MGLGVGDACLRVNDRNPGTVIAIVHAKAGIAITVPGLPAEV